MNTGKDGYAAGFAFLASKLERAVERALINENAGEVLQFELMAALSDDFRLPDALTEVSGQCQLEFTWHKDEVEVCIYGDGVAQAQNLALRQAELRSVDTDSIRYRFCFDQNGQARIVLERSPEIIEGLQSFMVKLGPKAL